jgi:hypothetical protein
MTDYKEQIKKIDNIGMSLVFDLIIQDLINPFTDPRESKDVVRTPIDQRFSSKELFYSLIDETERTFKTGMIVSATVSRVFDAMGDKPARIMCRLENGLDANINENDADFFNQGGDRLSNTIEQGSIITGRIYQIKFGEKGSIDDNFSVILKCKQADLRTHDAYLDKLDIDPNDIPKEDKENMAFRVQEEQTQN